MNSGRQHDLTFHKSPYWFSRPRANIGDIGSQSTAFDFGERGNRWQTTNGRGERRRARISCRLRRGTRAKKEESPGLDGAAADFLAYNGPTAQGLATPGQGLGGWVWVSGFGFRVSSFGFRVSDFRFRVSATPDSENKVAAISPLFADPPPKGPQR